MYKLLIWLVFVLSWGNFVGCASTQSTKHKVHPVARATKNFKYKNPKSYQVFNRTYKVMPTSEGYKEHGIASWYGGKFHGRTTSTGEVYDMYKLTAAHKTLPLPCYVRVRNLDNDKSIILKVNDRGPFVDPRIIDVSYAAAMKLGMIQNGLARVEVQAISVSQLQPVSNAAPLNPLQNAKSKYLQLLQSPLTHSTSAQIQNVKSPQNSSISSNNTEIKIPKIETTRPKIEITKPKIETTRPKITLQQRLPQHKTNN